MGCPIRFSHGECWVFDGVRLRFERELGEGLLYFVVERTLAPLQVENADGLLVAPSSSWALEAFAEGRLRRIRDAGQVTLARKVAEESEYSSEDIAELDSWAAMRLFVLREFDRIGHCGTGEAGIQIALDQVWAENPAEVAAFPRRPHPCTVRRWMMGRGSPGERRLRQMISMSGRVPRRRRLDVVRLALLQRAAVWYWSRPGANITQAHARLSRQIIKINRWRRAGSSGLDPLRPISLETVRVEVGRLECFATYAAKFGLPKAKARFKPAGKGLRASRALQLGCMDHTLLDGVAVIDADYMLPIGRPWLTLLIDVKTRCVVGFVLSFEPPSIYQAMECVKRANRPKLPLAARKPKYPVLVQIFGRFDEIVVDNGWELSGNSFEDALLDAGTSLRLAPVRSPKHKAIVERFFRTLNQLLNEQLPGGVLKPELLRELGYDPYKDAVLTLAELEDLIWEAICTYHVRQHRALRRPPADVWQQDLRAHGVAVIGDDSQLDKMAGQMKYPCTLTTSGVQLFDLQYHDEALTGPLLEDLVPLQPVRKRRRGSATAVVKVKFNPARISEIHVWNERRKHYVTLECTDQRYTERLSLWHHNKLKEWAEQAGLAFSSEEDRLEALGQLVAKVEASAPDLKIRQRRAAARLMRAPQVQEVLGAGSIVRVYAPSRHDGMAPVIPHDPLANHRIDGQTPPGRPPRGPKRKRGQAAAASPASAKPSKLEAIDFPDDDASTEGEDGEGFEP